MDALMNPKSIAVVGASQRVTRGTRVLQNLRTAKYTGKVYAVNPRFDEIEGFPCFPSVAEIPYHVDHVVAAIPASGVADVLEQSFEAGARGAVVLASGFGEGGHAEENADRVARVRALAKRGMDICGPNCYGVFNLRTGAAAFSGSIADPLTVGSVALVSQSGGFSNAISDPLMEDRMVGFSYLVSCGNQLGTSVEDYLGYFVEDENTTVAAAFVEGFREPWKLERVGERARELDKPIIVLKVGRTDTGRKAAMSHTGSIAGSPQILASMLDRYGIQLVDNVDELCEAIAMFAVMQNRRPFRREIIVVTGSGGEGAHVADAADRAGLAFAELSEQTKAGLVAVLPEFGATNNPVDGTGAMFEAPELFPGLLSSVLKEPEDRLIAINFGSRPPGGDFAPMRGFANTVAEQIGDHVGRVVGYTTCSLGPVDAPLARTLHNAGVPLLQGTEKSVKAMALLQKYMARREESYPAPATPRAAQPLSSAAGVLPFLDAKRVLEAFDVPVVESELATSAQGAVAAAERIGYPVALKVESPLIPHKSDAGCVVLGCKSKEAVRAAFDTIVERSTNAFVPTIDGVVVQAMAEGRIEAFAGITTDPLLGPAVVFGLGGVFIEILNDVVTEIPPIDVDRARRMILGIRGSSTLTGARGTEPADVDALVKVLVGLGELALAYQDSLVAVDVNPLMVGRHGEGVVAVDALFEVSDQKVSRGTAR
jgi:acetate---CoA ligase (ADP-forming)